MRSGLVQRTSFTYISQNWAWMGTPICPHLGRKRKQRDGMHYRRPPLGRLRPRVLDHKDQTQRAQNKKRDKNDIPTTRGLQHPQKGACESPEGAREEE